MSLAKIPLGAQAAGRQRNLDPRALTDSVLLRTDSGLLRTKHLVVPAAVTVAFGASTRAAIGIVVELNRQISNLEAELATHFEMQPGRRHPLFPSR